MGDVLEGAITTIRRYPRQMLLPSLAVALISAVPLLLVALSLGLTGLDLEAGSDVDPENVVTTVLGVLAALLLWVLGLVIATTVVTGVLTVVVSRATMGEDITLGQVWQRFRPRLWRLLATVILVGLLVGAPWLLGWTLLGVGIAAESGALIGLAVLAWIAAAVLSVWLWVRLSLSTPAVVLESLEDGSPISPTTAMRRSISLVTGAWWRTMGLLLLAAVLAAVVSSVVNIPANIAGIALESAVSTGGAAVAVTVVLALVGSVVGQTITMPFFAAVIALVYIDRRIRREGLAEALARAAQ